MVVDRFGAGCRWWPRPGESRRAPPFLRATGLKLWWGRARRLLNQWRSVPFLPGEVSPTCSLTASRPRPIESPCDIHVSGRFLILRTPPSRWMASGCLVHLYAHRSQLPLECGARINGLLQVMLVMPCRQTKASIVRPNRHPNGMTSLCRSSPTEHRVGHANKWSSRRGVSLHHCEVEMMVAKTLVDLVMELMEVL